MPLVVSMVTMGSSPLRCEVTLSEAKGACLVAWLLRSAQDDSFLFHVPDQLQQ
jgi:hypothetical protein